MLVGIGIGLSTGAYFGLKQAIEGLFLGAVLGFAIGALVAVAVSQLVKRTADIYEGPTMLEIDAD